MACFNTLLIVPLCNLKCMLNRFLCLYGKIIQIHNLNFKNSGAIQQMTNHNTLTVNLSYNKSNNMKKFQESRETNE